MPDKYVRDWTDAIRGGLTDGHYYKMVRADDGRLSLESWADDGSGDIGLDPVEVSESAFDNFVGLCAFAAEVGALLELDPVTIIKSIRG